MVQVCAWRLLTGLLCGSTLPESGADRVRAGGRRGGDMTDQRFAPMTRRRFLGLMGGVASLGLAAACGQPAAPAKPADSSPAKPAEAAKPAAPAAAAPTQAAPAQAAKPAEAAMPAAPAPAASGKPAGKPVGNKPD